MTRALVIGGAGFIGAAACKELMRRGVETVAAGRKSRPYGTFTSYRAFDRNDPEQLRAAIDTVRPDVVLDLVGGAERVTGVARSLMVACEGVEPPVAALRAGAVIGPDDPTLRIAALIQRIEDGGPIEVPGETFERPANLAWVKDLGYACALACQAPEPPSGVYGVAFDDVSLKTLVEALGRALGQTPRLQPRPQSEFPYAVGAPDPAEVERARNELGFRPSALEDALPEILAWYRVRRASHPARA